MQQVSHIGQPADVWTAAQIDISCRNPLGCRYGCSPRLLKSHLGHLEASSALQHWMASARPHIQKHSPAHPNTNAALEEQAGLSSDASIGHGRDSGRWKGGSQCW